MMAQPMPDTPFTPETLAERWGCSSQHIRDLARSGRLQALRAGRLIHMPAAVVRDFEQPSLDQTGPEIMAKRST